MDHPRVANENRRQNRPRASCALSERALVILQEVRPLASGDASLVFPGPVSGKPMDDTALTRVLRRMGSDAKCMAFEARSVIGLAMRRISRAKSQKVA